MARIYLILLIGIIIVSFGSIIVRWTGEVPPGIIAFYRVFLASLLLSVYTFKKDPKRIFNRPHWQYFIAGALLAIHFITWIASLQITTIAHSIFLVSTHPLFAVLFSGFFLREFPALRTAPSFLIAIFGMYLIVSQDIGGGEYYIIGDLLAVLSAISFAGYLLIARLHRSRGDFLVYLILVYTTAAVVCAGFSLLQGDNFSGYSWTSWLMMVLLAIGPHLSGHSILNWCSRQMAVFKVNLALLLEPVIATIGGILIFNELPRPLFYVGAACILAALLYLLYAERLPDQKIST